MRSVDQSHGGVEIATRTRMPFLLDCTGSQRPRCGCSCVPSSHVISPTAAFVHVPLRDALSNKIVSHSIRFARGCSVLRLISSSATQRGPLAGVNLLWICLRTHTIQAFNRGVVASGLTLMPNSTTQIRCVLNLSFPRSGHIVRQSWISSPVDNREN